ncbi:MAG: electron transfer flavoprotein subunit alpha, partial [Nitrospinaceae bacterium]|nr:electron transfer flavoprotein subunit alpha [Nitrospinaceae bacterium]
MSNDVLILAERINDRISLVSSELCNIGKNLANENGGSLVALLLGGEGTKDLAKGLIALGADKVIAAEANILEGYNNAAYTQVVDTAYKEVSPSIFLTGCTSIGRDIAPRIAFRNNTSFANDCTELSLEDGKLSAVRPVYAGNAMSHVRSKTETATATIRMKAFALADEDEGRSGEMGEIAVS